MWLDKLQKTAVPGSVILIRFLVGFVFFSEGIQKFLYPDQVGAGRFLRIGIPAASFMGPFVGVVEIVCGVLVLAGLFTRLGALLLAITISVAILSTKIPILLGHGFWTFEVAKLARYGFWSMAHEARTDFCMLLGSLFLCWEGAGVLSLDYRLWKARQSPAPEEK